jgi:HAD superfamily hydrolase (TIGR01490 family)
MSGRPQSVAAFFDVDGTLLGEPSLEQRFLASLRYRHEIPMGNYLLWLARAARLAPSGMAMMRHANKTYLRGVSWERLRNAVHQGDPAARAISGQAETATPRFFPGAVDELVWHARQGHAIFLVSGTPAPLAQEVALALTIRLAIRGIAGSIGIAATRLEERDGQCTGRILGEAMFGEAKERAVRRLAAEKGFDLRRSYAYGDSSTDRWMLEAVGSPRAVNPSWRLKRLAQARGWTVMRWLPKEDFTQVPRSSLSAQRIPKGIFGPEKVG